MPKNRPRCYCGGDTKRNGTTSKGTTRWRCKACGASVNKSRPDVTKAATFTQFIEHCTTTTSLEAVADRIGVSASTMKRRFSWCWLVDVPDPTGHTGRIYDQVFIDGTYTASGCLIVAATLDHVIAWHWCKRETTRAYKQLLERIPAPLIAVIDGAKELPVPSNSVGRPRSSNAAWCMLNAWYGATPPHAHALMPGEPSTS